RGEPLGGPQVELLVVRAVAEARIPREVEHDVDTGKRAPGQCGCVVVGEECLRERGLLDEATVEQIDGVTRAGDPDHVVPGFEQLGAQHAPDEAGRPGYCDSHSASPVTVWRCPLSAARVP